MIFLDEALNIRRFTPASTRYFNFQDIDIGRPISHFSSQVELPDIEHQYQKITENGHAFTTQVQDRNSNTIKLKMLPYKTQDDDIEGLVLIFDEPD